MGAIPPGLRTGTRANNNRGNNSMNNMQLSPMQNYLKPNYRSSNGNGGSNSPNGGGNGNGMEDGNVENGAAGTSGSRLSVPHTKRDRFVVRCLETGAEEEVITSQKYLATLRVGIPHKHPFGVSKRIIGPNGRNMKLIASLVRGAKIRLRGEGFQEKDAHQPLQLNISSHSVEGYILAKHLLLKLLSQIHSNFTDASGQEPKASLRVTEHPMNPVYTPEFEQQFLQTAREQTLDSVLFTTTVQQTAITMSERDCLNKLALANGVCGGGVSSSSSATGVDEGGTHEGGSSSASSEMEVGVVVSGHNIHEKPNEESEKTDSI